VGQGLYAGGVVVVVVVVGGGGGGGGGGGDSGQLLQLTGHTSLIVMLPSP